MIKRPETIDHFHITLDVEITEVGGTLAQLQRLGYKIAGCELVTDVLTFKQKQHKVYDVTGEELVMTWLAEHPAFKLSELASHFKSLGRVQSSASYSVAKLVHKGVLLNLGRGQYRRSIPLLEARPQETPPEEQAPHRQKRHEIGNRMLMWGTIGKRQNFLASELREKFKEEGRPTSSMYSQLSKMTDEGFFKQIEEGKYQVLKRPEKRHLNGKSNGVAAHA